MEAEEYEAEMARMRKRIAFYERQTARANAVAVFGSRATVVLGVVGVVLNGLNLVAEPGLRSAAWLVVSVALTLSAVWSIAGEKRKKREQKSSPAA